jgi:hypothetical protein
LSAEIAEEVSHGAVWGWVQKSGRALRWEEDRRREAVFEDGELFDSMSTEFAARKMKVKHLVKVE